VPRTIRNYSRAGVGGIRGLMGVVDGVAAVGGPVVVLASGVSVSAQSGVLRTRRVQRHRMEIQPVHSKMKRSCMAARAAQAHQFHAHSDTCCFV
jgi:hypothetical protein